MTKLKRELNKDGTETGQRQSKKPRFNQKSEAARAFLANYFSEDNGRCEKIPNPRFGREELRLPIWLTKAKVYEVYKDDCENCKSKCVLHPLDNV